MKHRFERRNQAARGHDGRKNRDPLSQVLISLLNEIDKATNQQKRYRLADELYQMAVGYEERVGKKLIRHLPNVAAIKEIIDRVEGKAAQKVSVESDAGSAAQIAFIETVIVHPNGERERIGEDPKVIDGNGPGERVRITRP